MRQALWKLQSTLVLALALCWLGAVPLPARADATPAAATDEPSPSATPPPADCTPVGEADAAAILGFNVQPPDPPSQSAGICFYTARDLSRTGDLSYAVITPDRLAQRRAFFRAFARRCAPAAPGTLNELACRQFLKLAVAATIDDYYAARTGTGDASPVPGLGESAVASGNALYVKRGQAVFEITVLRGEDFDRDGAIQVAKELLVRVPR
jgi:hypothetical protein